MRTTIANITDEDFIHCFQNGLGSKNIYRNFGRNQPKTIVELLDNGLTRRTRRMSASPSTTATSATIATAPTKASGTTRNCDIQVLRKKTH
jgi:hypothetical protein